MSLPAQIIEATEAFYAWERRGRGWELSPDPVVLEPQFVPFWYMQPTPLPAQDDGQRQTFLSSLFASLKAAFVPPPPQHNQEPLPEIDLSPYPLQREDGPRHAFSLVLPPGAVVKPALAELALLNLSRLNRHLSFELVGDSKQVRCLFSASPADGAVAEAHFRNCFPDGVVQEAKDSLVDVWLKAPRGHGMVVDLGLSEEFLRPLQTFSTYDPDPLLGIVSALETLQPGEAAAWQVLWEPVINPWAQQMLWAVTGEDSDFFLDAPEMAALTREKVRHPLYAVACRLWARTESEDRTLAVLRTLMGALAAYGRPGSNQFVPLSNDYYDDEVHEHDFFLRQSCRTGMLLNSLELSSLVHPPSGSVRVPSLQRYAARTCLSPARAVAAGYMLGHNPHGGTATPVALALEDRLKHMHLIGASGSGKSTLLTQLILQDIQAGRGCAVLDPHGDLIDEIMGRVPPERRDDVVVFDPSDEEACVCFNVLAARSDIEKNLLASDLAGIFRRLSTSWGDQMHTVLANAILAMLEHPEGATLLELRQFLVDKDYRRQFLATIADPDIAFYWEKEFPLLSGRPQGPILTRLDAFLRPKLLRQVVGEKAGTIDLGEIMQTNKIFLAKLSHGLIGEENAYLLGALLVAKLHQLAVARQALAQEARNPYFLYIDEFHHFTTPSMAGLLSGARKYRLGLVLAHQDLHQLEQGDASVGKALLANAYTRVIFRVADDDARKLSGSLDYFEPRDLQNLKTGEAVVRIEGPSGVCSIQVPALPAIGGSEAEARRQEVLEHSRQTYAIPRSALRRAPTVTPAQPPEAAAEPAVPAVRREQTPPKPAPAAPQDQQPPVPIKSPAAKQTKPSRRKSPATAPVTQEMGVGGKEHKYFQHLLKQWAEGIGYKATVEKALPGGGSVDVALETANLHIACEISITTSPEHERGNVAKCLESGFSHVFLIAPDKKQREKLLEALQVDLKQHENLAVLSPELLFEKVEELIASQASRQETIRGYKVKVNYKQVPEPEKQARKKALSGVLMQSLRRHKDS